MLLRELCKKKYILFLLTVILMGCQQEKREYQYISPEVTETLALARNLAKAYGYDLTVKSNIKIGSVAGGLDGYCQYQYPRNTIVLNVFIWPKLTQTQKLYLLLHEIGHCELNRRHTNGVMYVSGQYLPASIMDTGWIGRVASGSEILGHEYYIRELFEN